MGKLQILKNIFDYHYQSGEEHLLYCPKCNHHKPKLSINIEKNVFKCWVCEYAGTSIYRLVRRYGNYNQKKTWKELDGQVDLNGFEAKIQSIFDDDIKEEHENLVSLPKEFISLANNNLPKSSLLAKRYLHTRGLTMEDIIYWKIGYCDAGEYEGRIVVPSFNIEGRANYFVARSYTDSWRKYMNPSVAKNKMIFNHLNLDFDDDLIITEGVFDAIIAGKNSVPVLGSSLREGSSLFQEVVKYDTPIYVALDKDAEKKAIQLSKRFLKHGVEVYKIDIDPFNDVGEMTREQFLERKSRANHVDSYNNFSHQIKNSFFC